MKILFFLLIIFTAMNTDAQTPYTATTGSDNVLILDGIITKYALQNNASLNTWYTTNQSGYTPDPTVLNAMQNAGDKQLVVFGGTWCGDTKFILPKFFKLQEQGNFPDTKVSFFGVDRQKNTLGNIADAFGVTNVPTIIVMKNGKEVGRVVEYGTTGKWDTELAELLRK